MNPRFLATAGLLLAFAVLLALPVVFQGEPADHVQPVLVGGRENPHLDDDAHRSGRRTKSERLRAAVSPRPAAGDAVLPAGGGVTDGGGPARGSGSSFDGDDNSDSDDASEDPRGAEGGGPDDDGNVGEPPANPARPEPSDEDENGEEGGPTDKDDNEDTDRAEDDELEHEDSHGDETDE